MRGMGADGEDEVTAARGENHEGHSQVNQARFPDIGRNEFGRRLDSSKEQRQVASRDSPKAELVREDVAAVRKRGRGADAMVDEMGRRRERSRTRMTTAARNTHRVRVMRSVLGCSSPDIVAWCAVCGGARWVCGVCGCGVGGGGGRRQRL